jgi:8-oxo-dGTP pyrophosphatase MutT (NUDIX family)
MTPEERLRLISYPFDQLWMDLWLNHNCKFYKQEYRKALRSYNDILPSLKQLVENVQLCDDSPTEPQWGFPKGKKHMRETEIHAAIREFEEETKFDFSKVTIKSTVPVTEVFQGFNSKLYKTVYFIAEARCKLPIRYEQSDNPVRRLTISEEIGSMDWFNLVTSKNHLNIRRQDLLNKAYLRIKKQDWRNDPIEIETSAEDTRAQAL